MPIYEYKCGTCGQVFEVKQSFSDAPLTTHESCGGAVQRLISAPALQFKGSGWYITDYAKSGAGSKSTQSGAGEAGSSSAPKTDTPSSSPASSSTSTETKK